MSSGPASPETTGKFAGACSRYFGWAAAGLEGPQAAIPRRIGRVSKVSFMGNGGENEHPDGKCIS
jgi:hypothetical protein